MFLNKIGRWLCLPMESYVPLATDVAVEESLANRELQQTLHRDSEDGAPSPLPRSPTLALEKTLEEIRQYLRLLTAQKKTTELRGEADFTPLRQLVTNEWHHLALVIDRLTFWVLFVIFVIVTIAMYAHWMGIVFISKSRLFTYPVLCMAAMCQFLWEWIWMQVYKIKVRFPLLSNFLL